MHYRALVSSIGNHDNFPCTSQHFDLLYEIEDDFLDYENNNERAFICLNTLIKAANFHNA